MRRHDDNGENKQQEEQSSILLPSIITTNIKKVQSEQERITESIHVMQLYIESLISSFQSRLDDYRSRFEAIANLFDSCELSDEKINSLKSTVLHASIQTDSKHTLYDLISTKPDHVKQYADYLKIIVDRTREEYNDRHGTVLQAQQRHKEHMEEDKRQHERNLEQVKSMEEQDEETMYEQVMSLKKATVVRLQKLASHVRTTGQALRKSIQFEMIGMEVEELDRLVSKLRGIDHFETNHSISLLELERRRRWQDSVLKEIGRASCRERVL